VGSSTSYDRFVITCASSSQQMSTPVLDGLLDFTPAQNAQWPLGGKKDQCAGEGPRLTGTTPAMGYLVSCGFE